MSWTNVANCLRCGAPIYVTGGEGVDFPDMRYTCTCWDVNKKDRTETLTSYGPKFITTTTDKVKDKEA